MLRNTARHERPRFGHGNFDVASVKADGPKRSVAKARTHPCAVRARCIGTIFAAGPLLGLLSFLKDKPNWGLAIRRPIFSISKNDFKRIPDAMGADIN
jgi:hypothetical protein